MTFNPRFEQEEADAAALEAASIGGVIDDDVEEAERPVLEAGGGESEGFEQAEEALIEHASHGDQQSAHAILHDQMRPEEQITGHEDAEADHSHSSELDEEGPADEE